MKDIGVLPQLQLIQSMTLGHFGVELGTTRRIQCSSRHRFSFPLVRSMLTGRKRGLKARWRDLFSNTSQWCDHRVEKINARFPDFKHKLTGEGLWLDDIRNPQWMRAKLAAMQPGTLQVNGFAWAQRLKRYVKAGQYIKTVEGFYQMQQERILPNSWTFLPVLNACAGLGALADGKRVHTQIIEVGCDTDVYVATGLVDMYAKCGSIKDAWSVFNTMGKHNVVSWNAMIGGYVKSGQGLKALELFRKMQVEGMEPDTITFVGVVNACARIPALEEGRRVHLQIIQRGSESDMYVANCLVDMYAKCGSIEDAWSVFNKMQVHDVISWNTMIGAYVTSGQGLKATELFGKMQQEGVEPSTVTFIGLLNAYASVGALEEGRRVHEKIKQTRFESDVYVSNCLVDMYVKCGSISDAWTVFNKMKEHTVVSWNAMIGGYVKCGQGLKAMELFRKMQTEGLEPDALTFVGVLNACTSLLALEEGRRIHGDLVRRGFESDVCVANCLVDMYAKCGSIEVAWNVFEMMRERSVVSWNAMIGGYVKSGHGLKAVELFRKMQLEQVDPDPVTFIGVLNACTSVASLEEGRRVHRQIIQRGCESHVYVANCLVDMYAKCGSIGDAWSVFNKMQEHNVVSWSAMIGAYVKYGQGLKAMELFWKMQQEGLEPDPVAFVEMLNACASVGALQEGKHVHEQIIQGGCESDDYVATCLVGMYAQCGSINDAWNVFKKMGEHDVVSWNAMIQGYVKSRQGLMALKLFQKMQLERVEPNAVTFVGVLNACASITALDEGRTIHEQIIQRGCESDVYVATGLIDMYAKCGSIGDAWSVLNEMREHNVVAWSAMIGGCVSSGHSLKAMELFQKMQQEQVQPNIATFIGVLNACASVAALEEGRRVHVQIIGRGWESDVNVATCLVDMYAKCGSIHDAWLVFDKMHEQNVVLWNAMIGGYAMHGHAKKAIGLFKRMGREGVEMDGITFTSLLSACNHGGLMKEGLRYFKSMTSCFDILPTIEQYACTVDLLARAGSLKDAEGMMKRISGEGNVSMWMSLLGACRIHGDIKMAEQAAKKCWELDPDNASGHVLLSNIYASGERGIVCSH